MHIPAYLRLFILIGFVSSCSPVVALPPAAKNDAPANISAQEIAALQPGDSIKLIVYGEETLTGSYPINADGRIFLPLLGDVQAQGLFPEALQQQLSRRLKEEGYLTAPLVTVDVAALRPVYVIGEVRNPGTYEWKPGFSVLQAIASAGGYTPRAAKNMVLIDRGQGDNKTRLNGQEQTPLLPGDSVTVRGRIF